MVDPNLSIVTHRSSDDGLDPPGEGVSVGSGGGVELGPQEGRIWLFSAPLGRGPPMGGWGRCTRFWLSIEFSTHGGVNPERGARGKCAVRGTGGVSRPSTGAGAFAGGRRAPSDALLARPSPKARPVACRPRPPVRVARTYPRVRQGAADEGDLLGRDRPHAWNDGPVAGVRRAPQAAADDCRRGPADRPVRQRRGAVRPRRLLAAAWSPRDEWPVRGWKPTGASPRRCVHAGSSPGTTSPSRRTSRGGSSR